MRKSLFRIILVVVLFTLCVSYAPAFAGNGNPPDSISTEEKALILNSAKETGVTVSVQEKSLRYKELKRVLGDNAPSEKEFKSWSPDKYRDYVSKHAYELGVQIWKTEVDKEGNVAHVKVAGPDKVTKKPDAPTAKSSGLPTVSPYPGPTNSAPVITGSPSLLLLDSKVYIPMTIGGNSRVNDLKARMDAAVAYLDRNFESNGQYAFLKDYPGCPLTVKANWDSSKYKYRMLGQYYIDHQGSVSSLGYTYVGPDYYYADVAFLTTTPLEYYTTWEDWQLLVSCDVEFNSFGTSTYQISKLAWYTTSVSDVSVFLGDTLVMANGYTFPINAPVTYTLTNNAVFPSHRYALRHSERLGYYVYTLLGQDDKAAKLAANLAHYNVGNAPDIYGPAFSFESNQPVDFMFTPAAYYDCTLTWDGMDSTVDFGLTPHRYGYESKVCTIPGAVQAYIALSRLDYLATALQALHVLNVTNNPDYAYPDPANPLINTTPRQIARRIEANGWNNIGVAAFQKDPAYASAIRTNVFTILEVTLGYLYDDPTSKQFADSLEEILIRTQWGMFPFDTNKGLTAQNGMLTRPGLQGSQMLSWGMGSLGYEYELPPYGIVNGLIDSYNMPNESVDVVSSNPETTTTLWAAYMWILWYKYGVAYPPQS